MSHAGTAPCRFLGWVDVDTDDDLGARDARAVDRVDPDATEPEDHHSCPRFDSRRMQDSAYPGDPGTAHAADHVQRCIGADLRDLHLAHGDVSGERSEVGKTGYLAALPGDGTSREGPEELVAQVRLRPPARRAVAALGHGQRDDLVARADHAKSA